MSAALQQQNQMFQEQLRIMHEGNIAVMNEFQGKHLKEIEIMKQEMERIKACRLFFCQSLQLNY